MAVHCENGVCSLVPNLGDLEREARVLTNREVIHQMTDEEFANMRGVYEVCSRMLALKYSDRFKEPICKVTSSKLPLKDSSMEKLCRQCYIDWLREENTGG